MLVSEALVLYVEGGRFSHSWCMCVISHGYDGFGGMKVMDGKHAGQFLGGWSHVGRCRSTSRVRSDTLMTPDHIAVQVRCSG